MGQSVQVESRWKWLYIISGLASMILGVLFLFGITRLISADYRTIGLFGWLAQLPDNWLMILFKLNAGLDGVTFDHLSGLNYLDIAILVLVAVLNIGLYAALRRTNRMWLLIAAITPFLGMMIFFATELAGRSGVMAATIIISFVMLQSDIFGKATAYLGILSGVLLLAGDFGTNGATYSMFVACLVGSGYVLLMIWYFLVCQRLLRLG